MKSVNLKLPFTLNDLLNNFEQLSNEELRKIAEKASQLISKRNNPSPKEREEALLKIIQKKLPTEFLEQYNILKLKMEEGIASKSELEEVKEYVEKITDLDDQKIQALAELSKLRNVPFQQLVLELNAFQCNNE